jgi:hypothetical protein
VYFFQPVPTPTFRRIPAVGGAASSSGSGDGRPRTRRSSIDRAVHRLRPSIPPDAPAGHPPDTTVIEEVDTGRITELPQPICIRPLVFRRQVHRWISSDGKV